MSSPDAREIVFAPLARRDLEDIFLYVVARWGEARAIADDAALRDQIERLRSFPLMGRARDELGAGSRALIVRDHMVIYRVGSEPDGREPILVGRIVHAARHPTQFSVEGG